MQKRSPKSKQGGKNTFPPNCYKLGNGWVVDFVFRRQRYRENLGPVSRTVAKETAARRKTAAAEGRLDMGPKIEDLSFEKAVEKYLEWYKANRKAYTFEKYATPASKALKTFFAGKRLSQISPFMIEKYKLDRKTACSCQGGPKRENKSSARCSECRHLVWARAEGTINRHLTLLKHLFNQCIEWKFAKVNPMDKVHTFREDNGRTRYLTEDEAHQLLASCNADLRIVVLAAMHTGFRKSELRSLRWTNIDFANGSATVESCYSKNGETRSVPLTDDLARELKKMKEERKPSGGDPVFTHAGKPWKCWREAFDGAAERGLKDFRFHDLRHCFGSWLAMSGTANKAQMELMGHKDPKMTLRYTHLSVEYKRQATAKLPRFGSELMEGESPRIPHTQEKSKVVGFSK